MSVFLSRADAADFLTKRGCATAPATLAKRAVTGDGPLYRTWGGRAIYEEADLLAWAEQRLGKKVRSTALREASNHLGIGAGDGSNEQ